LGAEKVDDKWCDRSEGENEATESIHRRVEIIFGVENLGRTKVYLCRFLQLWRVRHFRGDWD